jgi:1,4-alpha-glucan branching enzyme
VGERNDKKASSIAAGQGIGELDLHLFNEGRHHRLFDKLGAHPTLIDGKPCTRFAVWAPNAYEVSVIGDLNGWRPGAHPLAQLGTSGVFEGVIANVRQGERYKFHIRSRHDDYAVAKADPFGFRQELPPNTASVVWDLEYAWNDEAWLSQRKAKNALSAPISVYELHVGSWQRPAHAPSSWLNYRELAPRIADHVASLGFTHVELLPVMEHPFYPSWGYQVTGYFAPTSRYGSPQDLMFLIDTLHQRGIGVILDWVPAHFPSDEHGLGYFDGTHLFEHSDARQRIHPDWKSLIFNYGRLEVQSFLTSSALFWLERYHADALRVDGVASMLYLDYSRKPGEWIPNEHGGRENLEAIALLKHINQVVHEAVPDALTIAEESTAFPSVSRPIEHGGLGFDMKWDMGFMNDSLRYLARDPLHRSHHHEELTFRPMYAFSENYMLPLSHDEVVHGKGSLIGKMAGDRWQKRANLRLLYAYMFGLPGKKLLFMGAELGQEREWSHDRELDWGLAHDPEHAGFARLIGDLNQLYRREPSLHVHDTDSAGFEWVDLHDRQQSVIAFERRGRERDPAILVICNFTPVVRHDYRLGVQREGRYEELLNSDASIYGGSDQGNLGGAVAQAAVAGGHAPFFLSLTLPPLGALFFAVPSDG